MPTYEVVVRGKVQGVYFRAFAQQEALALGVTGWVRNEPDGSVRALLRHPDESVVQQLVRRLAVGPPAASVTALEISVPEADPPLPGFEIRP